MLLNQRASGFTLVELIVVIVLLGVLSVTAAPRFLDLSVDAYTEVVRAHASSFSTAVRLANLKWRVLGSPASLAGRDNIQLFGNGAEGQVDINANGWPAQSYAGIDAVLSTDSADDCFSLWGVMLDSSSGSASLGSDTDFRATYIGSNRCSFIYNQEATLSFQYDSNTGEVSVTL